MRRKKVLSIFLTVILVLAAAMPAYSEEKTSFSDIGGHWAKAIIEDNVERGFIRGYLDGTFRPDNSLTMAELVSMVNRMFGLTKTKSNNYSDVTGDEWYRGETDKAAYYQYWETTALKGNRYATRLDLLKMLDALLKIPATNKTAPFKDLKGLNTEELDLVNRCYAAGYIQGDGQGNSMIFSTLTRAQMLTFFENCLGYIVRTEEDVKDIPKGGKVTVIGQNIVLEGIEVKELILSPGIYTNVTIKNSKISTLNILLENTGNTVCLADTVPTEISNSKGISIKKTTENKLETTVNQSSNSSSGSSGNTYKTDAQVPKITANLTDHAVQPNDSLTLNATATVSDGGTITYQWYRAADASKTNPQAITTGAIYTVDTISEGVHYYYCTVTNTNTNTNKAVNGTTTKSVDTNVSKVTVTLIVNAELPQITTDLTDHTVQLNDPLILDATATVSDGGTIAYQWYRADNSLKTNPQAMTTDAIYTVDTTSEGVYYFYCNIKNINTAVNGNTTAAVDTAVSTVAVVPHMTGEGTKSNPFMINSIEDLCLIGTGINVDGHDYGWDKSYRLGRSLDLADPDSYEHASVNMDSLSGWDYVDESTKATSNTGGTNTSGFTPIGNNTNQFTGTFDGCNYTINHLYINEKYANYIGLFGKTNGAEVSNIGLNDVNINGSAGVGGLVGVNDNHSTVSNSYVIGNVSGSVTVGGLVGLNDNHSTVSNNYASGNVSMNAPGGSWIGGLVGFNDNDSIVSNSYASVNVSGNVFGGVAIGGLVGSNHNSMVSNSYATGNVSGSGSIGGLVGINNSTVSKSYAIGNVSGKASVGGLVGNNNNSTVEQSIAFNSKVSATISNANRIIGIDHSGVLNNNYAKSNMEVNGAAVTSGSAADINGENIDNMKSINNQTLLNWEFDTNGDSNGDHTYWVLMPGTNRPVLYTDPDGDGTFTKFGSDDGM